MNHFAASAVLCGGGREASPSRIPRPFVFSAHTGSSLTSAPRHKSTNMRNSQYSCQARAMVTCTWHCVTMYQYVLVALPFC